MVLPDWSIYLLHSLFWGAFAVTLLLRRALPAPRVDAAGATPSVARHSRSLVAVHTLAFGVMYFGVGAAVLPHRTPAWFAGQREVGALIIVAAAVLACATLAVFHSWRLKAEIAEGHRLATGGPFAYVRHPIYLSLDLLALGTAVWVPTVVVWLGVVAMVVGGELRARAEERVLSEAFGAEYAAYRARTRRFVPGVY